MIDLRSDTVTRPSPDMRAAIAAAEVGDDVWGDDPTVAELEAKAAALLGKDAAVFTASGSQANLAALMAHCGRGDEYIAGENAHCYKYEAGGAATLASIQPQPIRVLADGCLDLDHARAVVKPDDAHFAITRLLALENTHDGKVLPLSHHADAAAFAQEHGLGLHLDGARLWNAAVALNETPAAVAAGFDTVSVCLSKGLAAPVGSILAGSVELIQKARRARKMLGGGMRQAGLLAAAGIYALDHNIDRLADDHANAARLAEGLNQIEGVTVTGQNTNMVFVQFGDQHTPRIADAFKRNDIATAIGGPTTRLVTHADVSADDITTVIEVATDAAVHL